MCRTRASTGVALLLLILLSPENGEAQSEPVSLQDLIGRIVSAEVQFASEIRREGRLLPRSEKLTTTVHVKSDSQVELKTKRTGTNARGAQLDVRDFGGVFNIGEPGPRGGLIFESGKLILIRLFDEGAYRSVISFNWSNGELACSIEANYARGAAGKGKIIITTTRGKAELVSARVTSTDCHAR
jgi:hypothetical protein